MTQMTMASPQMKMSDHHRSTSALFTVYHGLVRHIPLLITSSNPVDQGVAGGIWASAGFALVAHAFGKSSGAEFPSIIQYLV